ncbi:MAG: hypothetical protein A2Y38_00520 [Spirochaetes bacterium GWB1_59_5]|nr:MAG: hypothetical protein A2Y38_00520 [Spirochaetes bacterium GWB1_59_5]
MILRGLKMDLAEVKERCSTLERCLPVGGYRVIIAKLHNEMIDEITALRSQLSIVEGARDTLYNLVGVEMALKEKAEAERDTWQSAHDAIYAELQEVKAERASDRDLMERLQAAYERGKEENTEAVRLQKKGEMLLESSERLRVALDAEFLQVKGERDRYREALEQVSSWHTEGQRNGFMVAHAIIDSARAALRAPATVGAHNRKEGVNESRVLVQFGCEHPLHKERGYRH